ncbi:dTDP-4-amino-4,6-dideoxygalactose transaminase [Jannaschia faecimaris]|uniref:dTDP-4-amino-4,6-dideoxygalactose transaminase n=1 Tax=Jannaschia faecimaris TaxID=1244108 RepID=A0A1H3JQZ5_9RHOB|nr:dTDP-4-amino-4,6-dideoxygalactose transaminase [Jannaschia faecimaris]SDY41945.1 dTDP-4-amino-4,6-dideoxygalactose transaminase [Jannaschia faecimaris]
MTPFNLPSFVGNELDYITKAIALGQLSGDGQFTKLCSQSIVAQTGAQDALLTHSCTAALEMAAILSDIQPGDEVIMPSFTFVSTANAVALRGGVPVFVDIDPVSLNLCPEQTQLAITSKTRAIFAVHYASVIAEMDVLAEISTDHGLLLVEDAAQAFGASFKGRKAGSFGDLAAFSFHETKNIVSGEGGALVINRPDLVERAEIIREKGTNRSRFMRGSVDKYTWVDIGSSFLPGELIAAFLYGQLEKARQITDRRRVICDRYAAGLASLAERGRVRLPAPMPDRTGNGHMFYLLMRDRADRDTFITAMREREMTTPFHYVPLHSAPAGLKFGRAVGPMTVTDAISASLVRLPLYYTMTDAQQDNVIAEILQILA